MKRVISLVVILAMILSLSACGQNNNTGDNAESNKGNISQYPLTIIDQAGREVTIEKEPERIVTSYYITSSLLIGLGLEHKVVGVENQAEKRPIYGLSAPEFLSLPAIGNVKELDIEGCAALEPDLVILPMKLSGTVETLESLGLTVMLVNPESQELLEEMITLVGIATDTQDRAEALVGWMQDQKAFLEDAAEGIEAAKVYLAGNSNLLSTAGKAMYQSAMIDLAGGENVANDIQDTYWAEISYEQLLAWNPEYIILASNAEYTVEDVLNNPNLKGCTAIKNGAVFQLPSDVEAWDSPVPSAILGSIWLGAILNPEQVPEEKFEETMRDYYETFYEFSYGEN